MAKQTTKRAERKRGDLPLWDSAKEHIGRGRGDVIRSSYIKAYTAVDETMDD